MTVASVVYSALTLGEAKEAMEAGGGGWDGGGEAGAGAGAAGAAGAGAAVTGVAAEGCALAGEMRGAVSAALGDDLNTPLAVAALSAPLKCINDLLTTKKGKKAPGRMTALRDLVTATEVGSHRNHRSARHPSAYYTPLHRLN